jgi:hypothetical protein
MKEAINLYLDEPSGSEHLAPMPDEKLKKTRSIVEVPVDPEVALYRLV